MSTKENNPYLPDLDREESQNKAAEPREANEKILVESGKKRPSSHYHYGHEPHVKIRIHLATKLLSINTRKSWADHQVKALFVA